ncbi:MAG: alpha/beta hydrolase-fold protein [Anditalea sp.]
MISKFRTVNISDPRFEVDHLRFITVKTSHLKGRGDICVFVPPDLQAGQEVPVIILLHGVYCSAWSWAYSTGVHLQAMDMIQRGEIPPVIIAMPSDGLWGDGSAYLPHNGYNFEKWIAEDVVEVLAEKITGAGKDSPLFIAGLSMGGFGALRIGAKYGQQFRGISAHSAITSLEQMKLFVEEDLDNYSQEDQMDEHVLGTFHQYRGNLPPVRFDCGTSDLLIEYNRTLHRQMQQQDIPHEYEEYPGGHQWSYWEKHISKSLRFFNKQLNS